MSCAHAPTDEECLAVVSATCKDTLLQLQKCLPEKEEGSDEVYVSSAVDQRETEGLAVTLIDSLKLLSPSSECLKMAEPFLCLYLFPLCNTANGTTYHPTYNECVVLTTDVCQSEWEIAVQLFSSNLPQCRDFDDVPSLYSVSKFCFCFCFCFKYSTSMYVDYSSLLVD